MILELPTKEIKDHFKKSAPQEACGVIVNNFGVIEYFPITNIAKDDQDFIMDTDEYLNIYYSKEVVGIVHSHVNISCNPSEYDILQCNAVQIPYYIFSYPSMEMHLLEPQ
jgi:proteasome lid subunit RPN8/RPN11